MNAAITIVAIVICVVGGIICFAIGYSRKCHIVKENNDVVIQTRKEIENQIKNTLFYKKNLEDKFNDLQTRYDNLQEEYKVNDKKLHDSYMENMVNASQKFADKTASLKSMYSAQENELNKQIVEIKNYLTMLQETKARAVEREQRDNIIKDNKDEYRIILSQKDKRDIDILNSVKDSLSNPRVLSMLIWSTFVQKKAKTLFNKILGTDKVCGIYKITNLETNQTYIGQAKDMASRWNTHLKCGCGIDTPQNNKLYAAMNKYGIDDFTFELVESCDEKDLNEKESFYIKMYNSVAFGYNSQEGNIGKSNN